MRIEINDIPSDQFMVHQHIIAGEVCYLVQPVHIGCDWTQQNKHFRSSLWNSQGELISAGFPKFTNWGEKPDVFPVPSSLDGATIVEKLDGSLLIVSVYKGQIILRTRGTVDAHKLDNGFELEIFERDVLPKLSTQLNENRSFLFEWLSPTNKIVLDYGPVPLFKLVGVVEHMDYSLWPQNVLDIFADQFGLFRPETYSFDTIESLLSSVEQWKDKEGVCVYSNGGQTIHKAKAAAYLLKHRFKEHATLEATVDMFVEYGYPSYADFEARLVQQFDWECFEMVRGFASQVIDAFKSVREIEAGMIAFVTPLKAVSRKEAAVGILSSYGQTNRASFVFSLLDGRSFGPDQYKKLLWQCLKKQNNSK